jgi:hypothetical protein
VSPDSRLTQTLTTLLAEGPTKTGPDFGKASPVGLLIVVLLLFSVFALVWSMNRHLRKIPASFDGLDGPDGATDDQRDADGAGAESADGAGIESGAGAESADADTPERTGEPGG